MDGQTGQVNNLATGKPLSANQAWPCMPDALNQGAAAAPITNKKTGVVKPESDHGRGMSQRGSERWATGKNPQGIKVTQTTPWQCILDHYYNDNGNGTGSRRGARDSYQENGPGDGLIEVGTSLLNLNGSVNQAQITGGVGYGYWSPSQRYIFGNDLSGVSPFKTTNILTGDSLQFPSSPYLYDTISWSPVGNTVDESKGRLVFALNGIGNLYTIDTDGNNQAQLTNKDSSTLEFEDPSFSPDGKSIVTVAGGPATGSSFSLIAILNSDGSNLRFLPPFLDNHLLCSYPTWSPDGTAIVVGCQSFIFSGGGSGDIYTVAADGSSTPQQLTHIAIPFYEPSSITQPAYTQDGRQIIFSTTNFGSGNSIENQLYRMNADGSALQTIGVSPSSGYVIPQVTRCRRFDTY